MYVLVHIVAAQACNSSFHTRLTLQVWQLMHKMGVQPDLPLYNLLIRCIRDCGVGDIKSLQSLLTGGATTEKLCDATSRGADETVSLGSAGDGDGHALPLKELEHGPEEFAPTTAFDNTASSEKDLPTDVDYGWDPNDASHIGGRNTAQATSGNTDSSQLYDSQHQPSSLTVHNSPATIPDVLSPMSDTSSVVALGDLSSKENRLALLGGVDGILSRMKRDGVSPDIITFSQLIGVAMPTSEAENELLTKMKSLKVKPDIDLINALIHKRCMRKDFAAAKARAILIDEILSSTYS